MRLAALATLLLLSGCGKDLYFGKLGECAGHAGPTPVRVADYCIDSTEVSEGDYQAFLNEQPSVVDQAPDCAWNDHFERQEYLSDDFLPAFDDARRNYPVGHVDFCDARTYCEWAGKRLCGRRGGGALSPSERSTDRSEWGAACAGSPARAYAYGQDFDVNACAVTGDYHEVGSSPSCEGGFPGVFDLIGNVWEWEDSCSDGPLESATCSRRGGAVLVMPETWSCTDAGDPSAAVRRQGDIGIRCCSD